jgi:phospholipid transport system substrate-binding protein
MAIHGRSPDRLADRLAKAIRRGLLALALLLPGAGVAAIPPTAPVEALDQAVLAVMRAGRTSSFVQRMQDLTPAVQAAFDLPFILAKAVGPRFAGFPPDAQESLLEVFTAFTVASYVANFDDYNGERFEVLPQTRQAGSDEVVQTVLVQTSGDPLKLDYVVTRQNGGWKIIDVLLNGSISRVALQRSDFRSLLGGGDAAPLIASLRGKVSRLEAGQRD